MFIRVLSHNNGMLIHTTRLYHNSHSSHHRLNITMFAVNRTALAVLSSNDFIRYVHVHVRLILASNSTTETMPLSCSQLSSTIEASVSVYPGLSFDSLIVHPNPTPAPDPLPRETILLILYIVVGALGALIIFIVLAAFVICCYLRCSKWVLVEFDQVSLTLSQLHSHNLSSNFKAKFPPFFLFTFCLNCAAP